MKLIILLPIIISLAAQPTISMAQNKVAPAHKNSKKTPNAHKKLPNAHKRVVYKTGAVLRKKPVNGIALGFGGVSYIFNNGLYYRHLDKGYTVVRPPIGLKISLLPKGYERIIIMGSSYYFFQGIYYVYDAGYYRVIDEPASLVTSSNSSSIANVIISQDEGLAENLSFQLGKAYSALPQGAQPVIVNGQQYFKYEDVYFLPQSSNNTVHYLAVKLE
ncbi:DUF6515 family protein [Thalassotalea piscium]